VRWKRIFIGIGAVLLLAAVAVLGMVRATMGGRGADFPDRSTPPRLDSEALEIVATLDEPPGNVAVSASGRVFLSIHPESRPEFFRVAEVVDGKLVPYPDEAAQAEMVAVLGVAVDRQERLWALDSGGPRLLGIDLARNEITIRHDFPPEIAPKGSFLNDLQVDPEGTTIYIADTSIIGRRPAIVVHDLKNGTSRRVLENHPSVVAQKWLIRAPERDMVYWGGLVALRPHVDSIALDRDGEWLYYAPMSHERMFRVRAADLRDPTLSADALAARVEDFGPKPQSDGLSMDLAGNIYITDVEHSAISVLGQDRELFTLVRDPRMRWPDGLSYGPDDWLYVTDSAIQHLVFQSPEHIRGQAPFQVFRFQPGEPGVPGQ
jgi:sugar lactone lactonase YvrE